MQLIWGGRQFVHVIHSCYSLRKKCLYSKLFWFAFSRIWTEYGEILCISPYSVGKMRTRLIPNTDTFYAVIRVIMSSFYSYYLCHFILLIPAKARLENNKYNHNLNQNARFISLKQQQQQKHLLENKLKNFLSVTDVGVQKCGWKRLLRICLIFTIVLGNALC